MDPLSALIVSMLTNPGPYIVAGLVVGFGSILLAIALLMEGLLR